MKAIIFLITLFLTTSAMSQNKAETWMFIQNTLTTNSYHSWKDGNISEENKSQVFVDDRTLNYCQMVIKTIRKYSRSYPELKVLQRNEFYLDFNFINFDSPSIKFEEDGGFLLITYSESTEDRFYRRVVVPPSFYDFTLGRLQYETDIRYAWIAIDGEARKSIIKAIKHLATLCKSPF